MLTYLVPIVVVAALIALSVRQVTVFEYERGLRYQSGRFTGVVNPGAYWILRSFTRIVRIDIRPKNVTVPGQEVIAADGVSLKLTAAARYQIVDPAKAVHAIADYQLGIYTVLQLALRDLVAGRPSESILAARAEINTRFLELTAPKAAQFGIELVDAEIKDVMFPGDLKKVFSQIVRARQEGLAALEKGSRRDGSSSKPGQMRHQCSCNGPR
jgi:regulator of protease activity HflC (stomatin/prohibitin superfamily)